MDLVRDKPSAAMRRGRRWLRGAVLLLAAACAVGFVDVAAPGPREDAVLGVTFSPRYARWLGLEPHHLQREMVESLGIRHVRLPVYWDEVEPVPGTYDFSDLDRFLDDNDAHGVSTILSVGYKQPRWPECFPPAWARDMPPAQMRGRILEVVKAAVAHTRMHAGIIMWQVENEPFVRFGDCNFDVLTPRFLVEEVQAIQGIDFRPVLLTDTGEGSTWLPALNMPGVHLGLSLYRDIPLAGMGMVHYPFPPWTYSARDWAARTLMRAEGATMISELQAEAWFDLGKPLDETADLQSLRFPAEAVVTGNVDYARRTQFSEVYLWGVEWWYWMAAHGHREYVEAARVLFLSSSARGSTRGE
jgi:hypothetical protein